MLYKESAIAVVVAFLLAAALPFGVLSVTQASATHDPNAIELENKQVSQGDDESMTIDSIELTAKKSTLRSSGTIEVEIIQGNETLDSTDVSTFELDTSMSTIEVNMDNLELQGDFEVLVEYLGSGVITVGDVDVIEATDTSGDDDDEEPQVPPADDDDDDGTDDDEEPQLDLENVIASEDFGTDGQTMNVSTVEFTAEKSTLRSSGTLTIAIIQGNETLDSDEISAHSLTTTAGDVESSFDDLEVTGDFQVVFMYDGSGVITIRGIDVPGATTPAEEPSEPDPNADTIQLTVNAVDQNNQPIEGIWVGVSRGLNTQGEWVPESFALEPGTYTVTMDDYYDSSTSTSYTFVSWTDSVQDNSRTADLTADETFTAKYNVVANSPPPTNEPPTSNPPPSNNPPPSGSGEITAYANRIPSSFWGPTFTSANAQMFFVLYNSTGYMVYSGFFDEDGNTVSGLTDGATYYIFATDCHHCHGGDHDVAFDHWENDSVENPRAVTPGNSVTAYYEYIPNTP